MSQACIAILKNVSKNFGSISALREVSLTILEGEFIVVLGPSASGKTVLLRTIGGLESADQGSMEANGKVGWVVEEGALLPWLTVGENVTLALSTAPVTDSQSKRKTRLALEMLDIQTLAQSYPKELEPEQRQRVAIARALVADPDIVVMDQPFTSLDLSAKVHMQDDVLKVWSNIGKAIIMSSQSVEEAVMLADKIILMNTGRVARVYDLSDMQRPRRQHPDNFAFQVEAVRRDFLALGE